MAAIISGRLCDTRTSTFLFVCVENTFGSFLSEGGNNSKAPSGWRAEGAGGSPTKAVDPNVRELLRGVDITLRQRKPRVVTPELVAEASRVAAFGCPDRCPVGAEGKGGGSAPPGATGKTFKELRWTRDELSKGVDNLLDYHGAPAQPLSRQNAG